MRVKPEHQALFLLLPLLCLFAGCSAGPKPFQTASDRPPAAAALFHDLDASVDQAGVRDAGSVRIPGFPYLRANRFLAALIPRLHDSRQKDAWIAALAELDRTARIREIANLPLAVLNDPAFDISRWEFSSREALQQAAAGYSRALSDHDMKAPGYVDAVAEAVRIPDEYRTAMRVMGLYPAAVVPVSIVTEQVHRRFAGWHQDSWDRLETDGRLVRYLPESSGPFTEADIHRIFGVHQRDAIGLPRLSPVEREALVRHFSPIIVQDTAAEYDHIGQVEWSGAGIRVAGEQPAVYYYLSHAFFKATPIFQLNYTLWYPARKGANAPRIEHGRLDGLTIRISLDTAGSPFMVDVMNNCGCYHFFVPRKRRVLDILPQPGALPPFVPRWLPESFPEDRLLVRVNSGWHQVVHLETTTTTAAADAPFVSYRLLPYEILESLPRPDGTFENLFDPEGIAKGSERIEPYIFFPMGIPRIGSMRQRGHHAVRLVGRAHFDDPNLFDRIFLFK